VTYPKSTSGAGTREGATPLDPDDAAELLPVHITTREQLNAWEQANISRAATWLFARRRHVLTISAVKSVHRNMFDETWKWAGTFRRSDTNIGVHWPTITESLIALLGDAEYWLAHGTYGLDEAAARFHHRLVFIHAFPNGNGRHGRLVTDALLRSRGRPAFTWGQGDLTCASHARTEYLRALRAADAGDLGPLLAFVRS